MLGSSRYNWLRLDVIDVVDVTGLFDATSVDETVAVGVADLDLTGVVGVANTGVFVVVDVTGVADKDDGCCVYGMDVTVRLLWSA
nr:hypothetical protein BgiMline_030680 [Biomphalaria glabrata]